MHVIEGQAKQNEKNQSDFFCSLTFNNILNIIIMLILVAVTIDIAVDGKLFDKAQEAVDKTNDKVGGTQDRIDELTGKLDQVTGKIKLSYEVEETLIKLTAKMKEKYETEGTFEGYMTNKLASMTSDEKDIMVFNGYKVCAEKATGNDFQFSSMEDFIEEGDLPDSNEDGVFSMADIAFTFGFDSTDEMLKSTTNAWGGFNNPYYDYWLDGTMMVSIQGAVEVPMNKISDGEYYTEYTGWAGETYTFKVRQGDLYNSVRVSIETGLAKVEPENIEDWKYTVNGDGTVTIKCYNVKDY